MALNFSRRPLFSRHLPEENLVSPMRIANGYLVDDKVENCFDYGCGSQESVHKDILDLLPSDPFGMDISTTFTAITGWLEDLEVDYGGYSNDHVGSSDTSYQLFAGLNYIWNNAMRFQTFPGNAKFDYGLNAAGGRFGDENVEFGGACASGHGAFDLASNMEDNFSMGNELMASNDVGNDICERNGGSHESCSSVCSDGVDHRPFGFALRFLDVQDLLAVESVCKSWRLMVQTDTLLWRNFHIDKPLNDKITDDILLQLTNRAQGTLQSLSLVKCSRITDEGLKHVLQNNPTLTKLSLPACTRLSIDGIITNLKEFKPLGTVGVKQLKIGEIKSVSKEQFEELKFLLGTDGQVRQSVHKPRFYHKGYFSCEDDRAIDIEMCPRCEHFRLVFDCPAEGCQKKENSPQACRACMICLSRCAQCGCCINDGDFFEETFCLQLLCSRCSPKYQEKHDNKISPPKSVALHESSCSMRLHG
ncbi:F-box protein SKIP14 [Mercurialis annua]|uniref:F-box protein SKIP14 n=1 Tax=Mercurialis annua TaxID=3986 RepID=UPI00215E5C47|nr:F-box protein SKIP14 [Mercurialis annua]